MNHIENAETMNAELTPYERLSFEYIEVEPPLEAVVVRGWVARLRQFFEGRA